MDWLGLAVGAVAGAVVGVVVQNVAYPSLSVKIANWRRRRFYAAANHAWVASEEQHGGLNLIQAGWSDTGVFPPGSVDFLLDGDFRLRDARLIEIRDRHTQSWTDAGFTNGTQVGMASFNIQRVSDEAEDQRDGMAHRLTLRMHRYSFFDHLATHFLRLNGTADERRLLSSVARSPQATVPVNQFPTPLSLGLSVFCEDGEVLAVARRTQAAASGGYWQPGSVYNCVGENACPRDFLTSPEGFQSSSPEVLARRGLYEEVGFSRQDIARSDLRIHSFAWAEDLLDYKFFGLVLTPMSSGELQDRWRAAPDRLETEGTSLMFFPARSRRDCLRLLDVMRDTETPWAPEARFSTVRSLVALRRISPTDLARRPRR